MKLLHLDSAITGDASVSRRLTADIVARLTAADPGIEIIRRDLFADPFAHFTLGDLPAPDGTTPVLEEFLAADVVVIGAPMYNFTIASQLKAWFDRILVAGRTFRYTETGPVGLAGGKRVIVAVSRGGVYGAGAPAAASEHAETWLRSVFDFIGVTPEFVIAEGILLGPEAKVAALARADDSIGALAA